MLSITDSTFSLGNLVFERLINLQNPWNNAVEYFKAKIYDDWFCKIE